jgi:Flp pilus assembly protein protease CpaA
VSLLLFPAYSILILLSILDFKTRKIPNSFILVAFGFLISLSLIAPEEFEFPWRKLLIGASLWIALLLLLPRTLEWIGSGDVKLLLLVVVISHEKVRWDLWLLATSLAAIATYLVIREKSSIPLAPAISAGTFIATLLTAA